MSTTTISLATIPLGFLAGIGGFDYWLGYAIGQPTKPEDHSGHGAKAWKDYFRVNTDHKVIGIQYVTTTFIFFIIGGLLALMFRAELAKPGSQFVDTWHLLDSAHGTYTAYLRVHGRLTLMRLGDGVHYTAAAGDLVAQAVVAALRRDYDLR